MVIDFKHDLSCEAIVGFLCYAHQHINISLWRVLFEPRAQRITIVIIEIFGSEVDDRILYCERLIVKQFIVFCQSCL